MSSTLADPKRPYKMYAAILSAFLSSFVATNATDMPAWAVGLLTAAIAAIAVYVTPNPTTAEPAGPGV
jgi:mono/diheme cytochrome c family protein